MKIINKKAIIMTAGALLAAALLSGCSGKKDTVVIRFTYPEESSAGINYPDASFAVISDIHLYDHSLGTSGAAFDKTMSSDRKLLLDGIDLLDYATETIIARGVGFVIVAGDLTKDGELINHELAAEKLRVFTDAGIPVYVVPGNHDVNNPDAVSYSGDSTTPVASVSADDFARIYGDYGYNAAILRDDDSLSYVTEPVDGLWLLALDACRYRENVPGKEEIVGGKISQQTADWIAAMLQTAINHDKAVMVMIHHGVVEHWNGQSKLHPDYLIEGYEEFAKFLASWNVRLAFTGHYHAQDIALGQFDDKFIWDIETGSLVTAPCPIRFVEFSDNTFNVSTDTIVDKLYPGTDFADNARAFVKQTVMIEARSVLKEYWASNKDADYLADAVGDAFDAHYAGDEDPALRPPFNKSRLNLWGRVIYGQQKYALDGLWADVPPADNNVRFSLSGE